MLSSLINVGDQVFIRIPEEIRLQGYSHYEDGTLVTVLGFLEIAYGHFNETGLRPGIYQNRLWVKVLPPDGKEYFEACDNLQLIDPAEYQRRLNERNQPSSNPLHRPNSKDFIRPLPETLFWEGDIVRIKSCNRSNSKPNPNSILFCIVGIDYLNLGRTMEIDRSDWPIYRIIDEYSSANNYLDQRLARESDLELVTRGSIWRLNHGEFEDHD